MIRGLLLLGVPLLLAIAILLRVLGDAPPRSEPDTDARYVLPYGSGGRGEFFRAPGSAVQVQNGKVSLPIGPGVHRLYLEIRSGSRRLVLKNVDPFEVVAGSVPLEVRVSAEEIPQAIAQLQAEKK